MSQKIV
jgi:hypothetical protein